MNQASLKKTKSEFNIMSKITEKTNLVDHVHTMINHVAQLISPVWPIETFIACNPLQGFESMSFEAALEESHRIYGVCDFDPNLHVINREMIKWCGAFLDQGQGTIEMPYRSDGFYAGFRALSVYDKFLHQGLETNKTWLSNLPNQAEAAINLCFAQLGVSLQDQATFLKETLSYLPGWAGYVKWRQDWRNTAPSRTDKTPVNLVEFIAVRLVITTLIWPGICHAKKSLHAVKTSPVNLVKTIEDAEQKYRQHLLAQLLSQHNKKQNHSNNRPDAQLVFCIDVRSEPFRHCLEEIGNYETFGFAGFFGLPVRLYDYMTGESSDSCPVLLKPRHDIYEVPTIHSHRCVKHHVYGKEKLTRFKQAYQDLKYNFSTPFSLVETLGVWCGFTMLARTLAPVRFTQFLGWLGKKIIPAVDTLPIVTLEKGDSLSGITPDDQVVYAETVLRMMGLTKNFAKLVIFCGHGSTTQNNPYASALDCGACGGNHGGANAKVLAGILNREFVRTSLQERGISIPEDTQFRAGEHNTTTDAFVLYPEDGESEIYLDGIEKIKKDFILAQEMNSKSRCQTFGESRYHDAMFATQKRSMDWSEVRPEWGLARNAAFIIGPRRLTKSIDLQGRCFLHSYEWHEDECGASLETILTAPMVVAEWINTQYLFSTLDNVTYGSGSKITHNVTAKVGIMQGNGSDLMHGLPLQSVMVTDEKSYHEPQRLLTVIYAPTTKIDPIIARQEILQKLFFNGWVKLIAIDPDENKPYELDRDGQWHVINLSDIHHASAFQKKYQEKGYSDEFASEDGLERVHS